MTRILITGASRGLGRALCAELTGRGHDVVATGRRRSDLDDVPAAARVQLDVCDPDSVTAAVSAVDHAVGGVDVLVNNAAAASGGGPVEAVPPSAVHEVLDTNVVGTLRVTQAFLPGMRERGSGLVAVVSSVAARIAPPLGGVYAASKAALEMLSEALRFELSHFGVRVVVLQLGGVKTGLATARTVHSSPPYAPLTDQVQARLAGWATGSWGMTPEEAARRVADVLETPDPPLRIPVGDDAQRFLSAAGARPDGTDPRAAGNRRGMGLDW
jgi:NAD(P)-dependent dehydrogenase (short-subunit alcohol dehydrogenase family)